MPPKTVLVVDDHSDTRFICRELLTHFGYNVIEACDGAEAVDAAFTHIPDLILLDFRMPRGDGLETVKHLRSHAVLNDTAIVLYTAAATHSIELHAVEGVQRVLFKPLGAVQLVRAIRELIGEPDDRASPLT